MGMETPNSPAPSGSTSMITNSVVPMPNDEAARKSELAPLVRVVESLNVPA